MPYIPQSARERLDPKIDAVGNLLREPAPRSPGVLNYVVTRLVARWLGTAPGYEQLNAAIGVLEAAKLELYRRQAAPYEDVKLRENGDAYYAYPVPGRASLTLPASYCRCDRIRLAEHVFSTGTSAGPGRAPESHSREECL